MTREEIMQLNTDYLNGCESEHKMNELFSYALEQQPVTTTNNDEPITVIYPTIVCDDAISRQAVLDINFKRIILTTAKPAETIEQKVKALPPVAPKQKGHWDHGKEISREYRGQTLVNINYLDWYCSNCHCVVEQSIKPEWSYCPNCGAKMIEPQESEEV